MRYFWQIFVALLLAAGATTPIEAAVIKGRIVDETGEPMMQATVRVLQGRDSTFVKGVMANNAGDYRIADLRNGKYILEYSYIGMLTEYRDVDLKEARLEVPTVTMRENSIMLKEVKVTGVKTQIKVMEDTVEYNADSYKTQPNAVVEDLLKRLPGVEVGTDGKITANGQEVKKILIDGKEFFSDDPQVASKNLPVNMVDKLQVVNRKSDLARLTGVDDGEDETVINLTVKKGMQNGYFGTAEAGYGTDDRYLGTFNVNRFWNGNQVTLLGNFNNINELGFTDSNGARFRRFGGNNGINTSQAVGLNFNVGKEEIIRVGGDVMYSHSDRDSRQTQERRYLLVDGMTSNMPKTTRDKGHNIRASFRVEWKPDSFNTLDFRPTFSYNLNDSWSSDSTLIRSGLGERVSLSRNRSNSDGKSLEFGANLIYSHNFRQRRGRSFSVQLRYNHTDVKEDERSFACNSFYQLAVGNDSLYEQMTDNHTWTNQAQARLTWTEPLGDVRKGNFLTFAYRVQYKWNDADKLVYDYPVNYSVTPPEIDHSDLLLDEDLSNRFRNYYFNQDIRIGYKHVTAAHNLDVGASLVPQQSRSIDLMDSRKNIDRWVWNIAPYLRYRYKIGKQTSLQMFYNGRSSQPTIAQMQPVADMSDPMKIVIGNPGLNPTFTHSLRIRFQDFNQDSQRSLMAMGFFQLAQNSIVSNTQFDRETGVQTTRYQNVNGVWNARVMTMFSTPFRNKAWQFSNHLMLSANQNKGFNNGIYNRSNSFNLSLSPSIAFRPDNLELELRPNYRLQLTHNTLPTQRDLTIHNFGGTFSGYYYTPIGIVLNTDLTYTATRGYSAGFDKNEWMWNASISYQTLRDKSLTFTIKAYDLLQQKSNITRTVTANYIDDIRYNDLTRYFMFTVSYRFNTFGHGNQPESRMGHGPMGGHGPMSPPPGGGRF